MKGTKNPLLDGQREKAGSQTIDKYLFQYHWALFKIINDHKQNSEYAVFIELHEDVVISNSLDSDSAKFEFNQVKTTATPFNTYQLVKRKKSGSSILGKLIKSGKEKPFSKIIEKLNLVSVNDFKLELTKTDVTLKTIKKEDLSKKQLKELEDELKKEIGVSEMPNNIQFIVTDLPQTNYQLATIGAIAQLIHTLFPNSYTDAKNIYTTLIDELIRKGKETYDFALWDEVLKNKALTSIQVSNVIAEFTNIKNEANIEIEFNQVCQEIGYNSLQTKKLKQHFTRYKTHRISNTSTLQIDTSKFLISEINLLFTKGINNVKDLITNIQNTMPTKLKKQFSTNEESASAIICEFIMMN